MKISTLGSKGTFSEQAALKYQEDSGDKGEVVFGKSIKDVFDLVGKDEVLLGIVPIENMIDGSVGETLDLLYHGDLKIIAEIVIPIQMCVAGLGNIEDLKTVMSKDKALGQCLGFIREHELKTENTLSTADAMKFVSEGNDKSLGAIGTKLAANEYGLNVMELGIEDKKNNVTRFFVISKNKEERQDKEYKTSIAIPPKVDKPGLLHDLLDSFATKDINLTKIESRPTKINLGEYVFYIDFIGHEQDESVQEAIKDIEKENILKVFGSYEKKY